MVDRGGGQKRAWLVGLAWCVAWGCDENASGAAVNEVSTPRALLPTPASATLPDASAVVPKPPSSLNKLALLAG